MGVKTSTLIASHLRFSLDRSMLNLPDRYKIIFTAWGAFLNNEGRLCVMTDTTNFIDIPPPLFNFSIPELPSHIRKGESINVPLRITSDSGISTQAKLEAYYNKSLISLNIIPEVLNIRPYSAADSILEIKALDNKYPAQVTLNASIALPSNPVLRSGNIIPSSSINHISKEIRFSFGILPELGLYDYVKWYAKYLGCSSLTSNCTYSWIRYRSDCCIAHQFKAKG